jgi:PAS domain S-box-containing protein
VTQGCSEYRFKAGIKCLDNVTPMVVPASDPLVQWMQLNAHLVSRSTLPHVIDTAARTMLEHSLDQLGAEVIVPLHGRSGVIGWLFVGHHITGRPFNQQDLEGLMALSEHVSSTLENALLYEELAVQKTLAETLLQSIPSGIVAASSDGTIRWFNSAAEEILGRSAAEVINCPVQGSIAGQLAGMLTACLRGQGSDDPVAWSPKHEKTRLSVVARRLENDKQCLGAVLVIRDMTREKQLQKEEQRLERATFWTELSAAMSHEIRNPLVAISTFAQLLPERYSDPEFRTEFSQIVSREISRLSGMIDQIDDFANPPSLEFKPVKISRIVRQAIARAKQEKPVEGLKVKTDFAQDMTMVLGDETALTECVSHLIVNALEAVHGQEEPAITVSTESGLNGIGRACVVRIRDNGGGIDDKATGKVFSPFCTSKTRGIGLGLPLVKRTVIDHQGHVSIESSELGTEVTVALPAVDGEDGVAAPREKASPEEQ